VEGHASHISPATAATASEPKVRRAGRGIRDRMRVKIDIYE
jgi:hypothetical protein